MAAIVTFFSVLLKIFLSYLEAFYRLVFPRPRKDIRDKVVLVTGAGQGIGRCLSLLFADAGAKLALWDIDEKNVQETAAEITSKGGSAIAYKCDVSSCDNVSRTATWVRQDFDNVDIVVNNAGIMTCKGFLQLTEKEFRRTMDINTLAHFWIVREFLPSMLDKNYGHIVTMSSMAGKAGGSMLTDYCASKFAVFGFTEALHEEIRVKYKKPGVKTTTVCPMFVNTNLIHSLKDRVNYCSGPEPAMQPEAVAAAIVDGVLRDKREIYLPPHAAVVDWNRAFLPRKGVEAIIDAAGAGFNDKTKHE